MSKTGEELIEAVRRARDREAVAHREARDAEFAEREATRRHRECCDERQRAENDLLAFTGRERF